MLPSMPSLTPHEQLTCLLVKYAARLMSACLSDMDLGLLSDSDSSSHSVCDPSPQSCIASPSDDSQTEGDDTSHSMCIQSLHHVYGFLHAMARTCVLFPNPPVPKVSQLELVLVSLHLNHPLRFCRNLRISPSTFDSLLSLIENDEVFFSDSNNYQMPQAYQFAMLLFRIRHFSNAASVASIAQWAGCSEGTVHLCSRWCMTAIMHLHSRAFARPTVAEIAKAKAWVASQSCRAWCKGYCMVDGSLVKLEDKPGHHGKAYFDRKSQYSLNVQVCHPLCFSLLLIDS